MFESMKRVSAGGWTLCPLTIRSLVCGIAVALTYCFVITTMMFYYLWIDYHKPCGYRTASVCNRSVDGWFVPLQIDNETVSRLRVPSGTVKNSDTQHIDSKIRALDNRYLRNERKLANVTAIRRVFDDSGFDNATYNNESSSKTGTRNVTELCPVKPPKLVGPLNMKVIFNPVREHSILKQYPDVQLGGHWKPPNCISRHKVALIIPYRDRKSHLDRLINFLIPILQKQLIDFRIIVSEQYGEGLFNKGRIMNAAFRVAEKFNVDCVIFHDVDMFPEDDRNPYTCPYQPRHLGAFVNVLKYDLWYNYLLGGVVVIRMEHYRRVNGHSNKFWGWGGEDDDLGRRVLANNMTIERPPKEFGKYTMLRHQKRKYAVKENISKLLNDTETRWPYDGLNITQWSIVSLVPKPLYYHLHVNVGEPPIAWTAG